ncbi:MAG: hypothetical protein HRT57_07330 [Crocinitomicaceae bacterium]|nr:hypothetical protein [Crocinitomicaceae bacterium]
MFNNYATGPKTRGILDRAPSRTWLEQFITNEDSLLRVEDKYTMEIQNWSPWKGYHQNPNMEKDDLDKLIDYITQ